MQSRRSLHMVSQVNRHIRMALHSRTQNSAAAQDMQNNEALSILDAPYRSQPTSQQQQHQQHL